MFLPTHRGKGAPAPEVESASARSRSTLNPTYSWLTSDRFADFEWLARSTTPRATVSADSTGTRQSGSSRVRWLWAGTVGQVVEQRITFGLAEIHQDAFGEPGGGLVVSETDRAQRGGLAFSQVGGDDDPLTGRGGSMRRQNPFFERQDVGYVQFE
jgi:hypothetical protein